MRSHPGHLPLLLILGVKAQKQHQELTRTSESNQKPEDLCHNIMLKEKYFLCLIANTHILLFAKLLFS
jgi:hypothetical protein